MEMLDVKDVDIGVEIRKLIQSNPDERSEAICKRLLVQYPELEHKRNVIVGVPAVLRRETGSPQIL